MKLEPELLRDLLLHVEEHATRVWDELETIKLDGWSEDQVTYHVVRAKEAGLIDASVDKLPDDTNPAVVHVFYSVHSLTMDGHGLLEAVREPKRMREIKERAKQIGAGSAKLFWGVAEAYVTEQIKRLSGLT